MLVLLCLSKVEERPGCRRCNAKGKEVLGNTYFEMTDGCMEYKNCVCRCNGSWYCPPQYATNTCVSQEDQVGRSAVRRAEGSAECQSCLVYGRLVFLLGWDGGSLNAVMPTRFRGLIFTCWGCYALCQRHQPTELAHSVYILFLCLSLSLWPFQLYLIP